MKHMKHEKLYKMFNDINRVSKKHLHENHDGRVLRMSKKYCKENNIENGIKETFSSGTRTWENFGIFQYEKPSEEYQEETRETEEEKEFKKTIELELRLAQLENEWRKK